MTLQVLPSDQLLLLVSLLPKAGLQGQLKLAAANLATAQGQEAQATLLLARSMSGETDGLQSALGQLHSQALAAAHATAFQLPSAAQCEEAWNAALLHQGLHTAVPGSSLSPEQPSVAVGGPDSLSAVSGFGYGYSSVVMPAPQLK